VEYEDTKTSIIFKNNENEPHLCTETNVKKSPIIVKQNTRLNLRQKIRHNHKVKIDSSTNPKKHEENSNQTNTIKSVTSKNLKPQLNESISLVPPPNEIERNSESKIFYNLEKPSTIHELPLVKETTVLKPLAPIGNITIFISLMF
jgi:hypothetical protein